jgi:hypothetical protein
MAGACRNVPPSVPIPSLLFTAGSSGENARKDSNWCGAARVVGRLRQRIACARRRDATGRDVKPGHSH